jgi:hypothetical protein
MTTLYILSVSDFMISKQRLVYVLEPLINKAYTLVT